MTSRKDGVASGREADSAMAPVSARKQKAVEAIEKFVTLLVRLGIPVEFIIGVVQRVCARLSKSHPPEMHAAVAEMDAAAHSLTLWHSDATYLDADGRPRPLPLRGSVPSLETLVAQADAQVSFEAVLNHLLHQSVLLEVGASTYVPLRRSICFRGSGDPYHARSFRTLNAMLGTLVHNGEPAENAPSWYEVYAVNSGIPVSAAAGFDHRMRKRADKFLEETDSDLLGLQRSWDGREPVRCIGVGIYRFEEQPEGGSSLESEPTADGSADAPADPDPDPGIRQ